MMKREDAIREINKVFIPRVAKDIIEALSNYSEIPNNSTTKNDLGVDAVSRQAVMDCFKKWQPYMATRLWDFEQELSNMPSVTPQEPKMGHWIEDDMTYCGVGLTNYKCDKCGEMGGSWRKGLKPDKLPKYCMNCGCRMVELQESENKE